MTAIASEIWRSSEPIPGNAPGRVDQGNHRQPKFFRQPHQAKRLAVTLGVRAAEIPLHIFLRVAAFLVGDDDTAMVPELRQAARHRFVIAEDTVAVQFDPIGEATLDIIERERAPNVPRQLHALPGGEVVVNRAARFADLVFHRLDFGIEIELVFVGMVLQILEPPLQLEDRFFKIQGMGFHGDEVGC